MQFLYFHLIDIPLVQSCKQYGVHFCGLFFYVLDVIRFPFLYHNNRHFLPTTPRSLIRHTIVCQFWPSLLECWPKKVFPKTQQYTVEFRRDGECSMLFDQMLTAEFGTESKNDNRLPTCAFIHSTASPLVGISE